MNKFPHLGDVFVDIDLTFWEVVGLTEGAERTFVHVHHGDSYANLDSASVFTDTQFARLSADHDLVRLELETKQRGPLPPRRVRDIA